MKASELRVGNWVTEKSFSSRPRALEGAYQVEINDLSYYFFLEPIPLTSEWLERFGFVDDETVGVWFGSKYKGTDIRFTIWDKYGKEPYRFTRNTPDDNIDILYVHQLQNLYHSLTGEELKIIGHLDGASPVLL